MVVEGEQISGTFSFSNVPLVCRWSIDMKSRKQFACPPEVRTLIDLVSDSVPFYMPVIQAENTDEADHKLHKLVDGLSSAIERPRTRLVWLGKMVRRYIWTGKII